MFDKIIKYITDINKWIAYVGLLLMVALVFCFSVSRTIGVPIIGDIEIVQFLMAVIIFASLAFTESTNSHISIGILTEKFPQSLQNILGIIGKLITLVFCLVVIWVFIQKMEYSTTSLLLKIPLYPFKFLLVIGFAAWCLELIKKLFNKKFID
ncbi:MULTISPECIES: TRAP transporter small permease [Neobacillus]|uniref:TRAP transporter small permease n=1 Tax=Neobacillus rhizophilus TaxID=2833579 RepID=A0A942U929_9BACI|nr:MULTISPECIES: TRAP transporter small permease [Neobacillus]MBS4214631.1 TRAP transporter small permease [Neobacillus rhizophilus]MBU8918533.1 TRAP transporter small permease [Bacillus sp. FJAT-29953]